MADVARFEGATGGARRLEYWRRRYRARLAGAMGVALEAVEIGDTFVAYLMALDLMRGDTARCKTGYPAASAAIAACEAIPNASKARVLALLGAGPRD